MLSTPPGSAVEASGDCTLPLKATPARLPLTVTGSVPLRLTIRLPLNSLLLGGTTMPVAAL